MPKKRPKGRRKRGGKVDCAIRSIHSERISENESERRGIEEQ